MAEKTIFAKICEAIRENDLYLFVTLFEQNKEQIDEVTVFGPWLHVAASYGRLEMVEHLLKLGVDINVEGGILGGNALNMAASDGHVETTEFLIKKGAKLDTREPLSNPLFGAIQGGYIDVVKLLVKYGIDYEIKYTGENMTNMDAIAFAREYGQTEIIEFLTALQTSK
jgi:uncharacterized protein